MSEATATKYRPIIYSGPMVRAILSGRKTQTRRVVNPQPESMYESLSDTPTELWFGDNRPLHQASFGVYCKYGKPGDRLWVRETWADVNSEGGPAIAYRADGVIRTWTEFSESFGPDFGCGPSMDYDAYPGHYAMWWSDLLRGEPDHNWRPSIFMPRWASRIILTLTEVRIERLRSISDSDVRAEGFSRGEEFQATWDPLNAHRGYGWDTNPWVWALTFAVSHGKDQQ